jgi:hypothetical protein
MGDEIELKIYSIASSISESIIFLDEDKGIRIIPIWIGPAEAQAIAIKMSGYTSPRPMTHDMIYSIIKALNANIEKVILTDIKDNTYYAEIIIKTAEKYINIDCRPSDAIALAVRFGCKIYANKKIFEKTQVLTKPISEDEVDKFKKDLENLKPTDFFRDEGKE